MADLLRGGAGATSAAKDPGLDLVKALQTARFNKRADDMLLAPPDEEDDKVMKERASENADRIRHDAITSFPHLAHIAPAMDAVPCDSQVFLRVLHGTSLSSDIGVCISAARRTSSVASALYKSWYDMHKPTMHIDCPAIPDNLTAAPPIPP
eukprot:6665393-Pyramimonas_sp.AAC.1